MPTLHTYIIDCGVERSTSISSLDYSQNFSSQVLAIVYAMAIRLITNRPEKARKCRIRYAESQHVLNGWELPPNTPGYQWVIHQHHHTVASSHPWLVGVGRECCRGLPSFCDAVIQTCFLITIWRTVEALVPTDMIGFQLFALGSFLIYEIAIQTGLIVGRGSSADCWWYVETENGE